MGWWRSIAAGACVVVTVVAIALLGPGLVGSPGEERAEDDRPAASRGRTTYAAIAFNRTDRKVGFGYLFSDRTGAEARALQECRRRSSAPADCQVIAWVGDGCVAVARALRSDGSVSQVTWGIGATCNSAQATALRNATRPSSVRVAVHSRAGAVR